MSPSVEPKERVYETIEDVKGDGSPCSAIREELKFCIRNTDCVKELRMTPKECLKTKHPSVPDKCHRLAYLFFECKRSVLDTRTRFRGRKGYTDEYSSK
ncbi:cytochrome c oxidase assembly factor 5 [Dermatophagoides farinae]|uniref:cytochrome c oxidase assembly factor 5 n=1 Tax=Dermatophagoides farinae TaxID=6954 RepID=UPI001F101DA5|nr:cytochrome c oxidase assembly factor 5-like [Dermatophagoides farinae]